ncbi:MAG: hypothetical protein Kow0074_05270 [Candidatus Zixiibacteriota bacterium]
MEFYVTQHHVWLMQDDVSEVQHNARACLDEIATQLRMAGYGLPPGHPAFAVGRDSLTIYVFADSTVDTLLYYVSFADSLNPVLVRDLPATGPRVYADGVEDLTVESLGGPLLRVTLTARAPRTEKEFLGGDGYRRRELSTEVRARNLSL